MTIPPPYSHQEESTKFILSHPRVLNFSDPGTGKTRAHLDAIQQRNSGKRALILAPLSIVESAWANDAKTFTPGLKVSVAFAKNRAAAFKEESDIVVTNHDAVKWIAQQVKKDPKFLTEFDTLIVDEATAFKNMAGRGGSQRAKAIAGLRHFFPYRQLMTGTPMSTHVTDIWALAFLADDGERLGSRFYQFRSQVCTARQVGPSAEMVKWEPRPGAVEQIMAMLSDITIRYRKEDCIDLPENSHIRIQTKLPKRVMNAYMDMYRESVAFINENPVKAVNAAARAQKLLQICTGAVYDEEGNENLIAVDRYKLVIDLVEERDWPCLVAYNWRHELRQMIKEVERKKIPYAVINSDVKDSERANVVQRFQNGDYKVLFAHPKSASHGLTLTAARTTIWPSPPMSTELYLQFNARIYRAGQKHKTETITIAAQDTREDAVYEAVSNNVKRVEDALFTLENLKTAR